MKRKLSSCQLSGITNNVSSELGCYEPLTDHVLWPDSLVTEAVYNLEKQSFKFIGKPIQQFVINKEEWNCENSAFYIWSPSLVLVKVRYLFELSAAIICRDHVNGEIAMSSELAKENTERLKARLLDTRLRIDTSWNDTSFWTGAYFDVKDFESAETLPWCDKKDIANETSTKAKEYKSYFDNKGWTRANRP